MSVRELINDYIADRRGSCRDPDKFLVKYLNELGGSYAAEYVLEALLNNNRFYISKAEVRRVLMMIKTGRGNRL
jgi:hypothetical protein